MKLVKAADGKVKQYQADPYIFKSGDAFYLYCTGADGVHCYRSDRLGHRLQCSR